MRLDIVLIHDIISSCSSIPMLVTSIPSHFHIMEILLISSSRVFLVGGRYSFFDLKDPQRQFHARFFRTGHWVEPIKNEDLSSKTCSALLQISFSDYTSVDASLASPLRNSISCSRIDSTGVHKMIRSLPFTPPLGQLMHGHTM